jgi:hypothetical protein
MIAEVERPYTGNVGVPVNPHFASGRSEKPLRDFDYVPRKSNRPPVLPALPETAVGETPRRITAVKIGYAPDPIIEMQDEVVPADSSFDHDI